VKKIIHPARDTGQVIVRFLKLLEASVVKTFSPGVQCSPGLIGYSKEIRFGSVYTGGVTPVPIPNTEVKPSKADGSVLVRACESR
jgi:hypothetical protein